MKHTRLDSIPLSERERLIDEWIVRKDFREILKERLLNGATFSQLADKFGYSERYIKKIVYKSEEKLFTHI